VCKLRGCIDMCQSIMMMWIWSLMVKGSVMKKTAGSESFGTSFPFDTRVSVAYPTFRHSKALNNIEAALPSSLDRHPITTTQSLSAFPPCQKASTAYTRYLANSTILTAHAHIPPRACHRQQACRLTPPLTMSPLSYPNSTTPIPIFAT